MILRVSSASSTSVGWKSVYCSWPTTSLPTLPSSWMTMPSSDQPCERADARRPLSLSERVMYTAGSPARAPSIRNCSPSVLLPVPGSPLIR